jgi:hypothetical protein
LIQPDLLNMFSSSSLFLAPLSWAHSLNQIS